MKKGTIIGLSVGFIGICGVAYWRRYDIINLFAKKEDTVSPDAITTEKPTPTSTGTGTSGGGSTTSGTTTTGTKPTTNIGVLNNNAGVRKYPTWNSSLIPMTYKASDGTTKTATALPKTSSVHILAKESAFYKVSFKMGATTYTGYIGTQFVDRF